MNSFLIYINMFKASTDSRIIFEIYWLDIAIRFMRTRMNVFVYFFSVSEILVIFYFNFILYKTVSINF